MGLKVEPAYIGQTGYLHPVELDRNLLEGLFQRSGGIRYGDFAISQGVGTRAIAIAPGRYFVLGQENAQQGGYFAWSDATETFLLAAAVGNPRIDTLLLRIIDDQYGSISGAPRAEFAVVQGVASGSPTARPDSDFNVGGSFYIPGGWARLGDVRVNVADTGSIPPGQITTRNRYVRPPNSIVLCLSTDRPSDPVLGDGIYEIDTGFRRTWNGSVWRQSEPWVSSQVLGSTAASVTISNIPTTLKTVRFSCTVRHDNASVYQDLLMRIGGDTGANYRWAGNFMQDAALGGANAIAQTFGRVGFVCGTTVVAGQYTTAEAVFQGWNSPHANNLTAMVRSGFTGTVGGHMLTWHGALTYHGSNAYTSLTVLPGAGSFIAGCQFVVEGWE
jgi:hypothetical protein